MTLNIYYKKRKSNNELNKINIKNQTYHFDHIIKFEDIGLDNILIDKKSCKYISVYNILCKTLFGVKPLPIRFNKIDGFSRIYDGTRYLVLFGCVKYDFIYSRIRYFIGRKCSITYVISHSYATRFIML